MSYLIDQWVMDKLLAQELTGAAEAIFALVKQKEWVMDTRKPYREIEAMVQEMDRNIASLYKDVEASIYDADIA